MNERIKDKIKEIEVYLMQLGEIVPDSLKEYQEDFKTKAACERYLERLVEAAEDLAFLAIKHLDLESPEEENEIFKILSRTKIISSISLMNLNVLRECVMSLLTSMGKLMTK